MWAYGADGNGMRCALAVHQQLRLQRSSLVYCMDRAYISARMATAGVPASLSRMEQKRALYAVDVYFREAWESLHRTPAAAPESFLHGIGAVIFKPDSVVSRSIIPAMEILSAHGFMPIAFSTVRLTRHLTRELWRYQMNSCTQMRRALIDSINEMTDSLLVVYGTNQSLLEYSAAEILSELKGASDPSERKEYQIRRQLDSRSALLNHIHTSDEAADVLREIGVCFPGHTQYDLLMQAQTGINLEHAVRAQVDELYHAKPFKDLGYQSCLERILLGPAGELLRCDRLEKETSSVAIDEFLWEALTQHADRGDIDWWDLISVAAESPTIRGLKVDRILPKQREVSFAPHSISMF